MTSDPAKEYVQSLALLAERFLSLRAQSAKQSRVVVGIAGAPGSGKSTLAENLVTELNQALAVKQESAVIVPMDGFHLDNNVLDEHGTRSVKGSPPTFDAAGFLSLLNRISVCCEQAVYVPVFDRSADLARNAAQEIKVNHSIVVVEGNYLLLDRPIWRDINGLLDCTVMLEVPIPTLESRLVQRWIGHGHSPEEARGRALSNDIPNAHLVVNESISADLYYESVR